MHKKEKRLPVPKGGDREPQFDEKKPRRVRACARQTASFSKKRQSSHRPQAVGAFGLPSFGQEIQEHGEDGGIGEVHKHASHNRHHEERLGRGGHTGR